VLGQVLQPLREVVLQEVPDEGRVGVLSKAVVDVSEDRPTAQPLRVSDLLVADAEEDVAMKVGVLVMAAPTPHAAKEVIAFATRRMLTGASDAFAVDADELHRSLAATFSLGCAGPVWVEAVTSTGRAVAMIGSDRLEACSARSTTASLGFCLRVGSGRSTQSLPGGCAHRSRSPW
jgi:hypothetical protein